MQKKKKKKKKNRNSVALNASDELKFIAKYHVPNTPTIAGAKNWYVGHFPEGSFSLRFFVHHLNDLTCANHLLRKKGDVIFSHKKPIH